MTMRSATKKKVAVAMIVAGCLLLIIGAVYLAVPADKLPSLLGKVAGSHVPRSKRGIVGVGLGVVVIAWAWSMLAQVKARRSRRRVAA
jgi:hypothetical protein